MTAMIQRKMKMAGGFFCIFAGLCFGAATAGAQSPVTITVDTSSHGYAVPADFSGLSFERGTENSGNAGVPGYFFSPSNSQLITLFRNIGLRSLRIGGGSVDDEPLVTNAANDNLFQFASAAGVTVIYSVRMLNTHNAFPDLKEQDAAIAGYIWQKYRPLVNSFAIGNEPDWHSYHVQGDPAIHESKPGVAGTAYPSWLADWSSFAATILGAAPGAKFSGPETGAYSPATYYEGESWTQHFADDEASSGAIANVTQHFYVGGGPGTTTSAQAINNMLSQDWVEDTAIGTQPTGAGNGKTTTFTPYPWLYNNNLAPVVADGVPYRLTELDDYLTGVPGASNGFASALWSLDAMHWWAQHGAAGVNFHNKQWIYTDTIVPDPNPCERICGDFQATPKGYGIKAFSMGGHGYVEPVTVNAPGSLDLTAYAIGDAHEIYVTVVNKTQSLAGDATDASVTIDPEGFGAATCSYMTLTDGQDGNAALMTASLGGAAITNNSRWQGQWTPVTGGRGRSCPVSVGAASAVVVKLRRASAYAGSLAINQNGALEVFAVDGAGDVWHNRQSAASVSESSPAGWHGWSSDLGGVTSSGGVASIRNLDNTLAIFVPTASGDVFRNQQEAPGGGWRGWRDMGASSEGLAHLVAGKGADGSLNVCGIGGNGDVWCAGESAPGIGWSSFTDLGGGAIEPGFAMAQDLSGRLEIFGVNSAGRVLTDLQSSSGSWGGWAPVAANYQGDEGRGSDGGWKLRGEYRTANPELNAHLAVLRNLDGRLEIFGTSRYGQLWEEVQQTPGGAWGSLMAIPGARVRADFVAGQESDGRLVIVGEGATGDAFGMDGSGRAERREPVWSIAQQWPGGPWGQWSSVGVAQLRSQLVLGNNADGRLQLFGIGGNGDVWSNWQSSEDGNWAGWVDFGGQGLQFSTAPEQRETGWPQGEGRQ